MKRAKKTQTSSNTPKESKITAEKFFSLQLKVIGELLKDHQKWTIGIFVFSMAINISTYVEMKFLEFATDSIYQYQNDELPFTRIVSMFVLFFGSLFLIRGVTNIYEKICAKYNNYVSFKVDQKITKKISELPYEYFESAEYHNEIHLAAKACTQYPEAIYGVTRIFNIICSLIIYNIILGRMSGVFIFLALISVGIGIVISSRVADYQLSYWKKYVSPEERKNTYFKDIYYNRVNQNNIQIKKAYKYFENKYHLYNKKTRINYLRLNLLSFLSEGIVTIIFIITFFLTSIAIGEKIVTGNLGLGYYSMVAAALLNLFATIKKFIKYVNGTNWYVKVLEAYYNVLNYSSDVNRQESSESSDNESVIATGISYQYPQSSKTALNNINFNFEKGDKIGVVGVNGSGKTTCMLIVLGLIKNYTGCLDKNDVVCAAVLQDFVKYQMSIKENIEIGVMGKKLSDEKIDEILKKVELYDYVKSKTEKANTLLGQLGNGEELSMGQWQRLAIARLLANEDANVWILDEPTAHLDPLAEIDIYKLIFNLSKDKIVIFVSHRLGFTKMANKILVFNDGKIVEEGSHESLMNNGGLYKQMYGNQKELFL